MPRCTVRCSWWSRLHTRPIRSVSPAMPDSSVIGSKYAMYCGQRLSGSRLPSRTANASARNIRSNFAALAHLREFDVVAEVGAGVDLRIRVQPGRDVMPGGMEERAQMHLTARGITLHRCHFLPVQLPFLEPLHGLVEIGRPPCVVLDEHLVATAPDWSAKCPGSPSVPAAAPPCWESRRRWLHVRGVTLVVGQHEVEELHRLLLVRRRAADAVVVAADGSTVRCEAKIGASTCWPAARGHRTPPPASPHRM